MNAPSITPNGAGGLLARLGRTGQGKVQLPGVFVIFLVLVYPVIGLVLARAAFGQDMLPLIFPLASGFALVGAIAAVGLYEMSKRREEGHEISWADIGWQIGDTWRRQVNAAVGTSNG